MVKVNGFANLIQRDVGSNPGTNLIVRVQLNHLKRPDGADEQ